jgi:hypothetical protein
MSEKVRKDVWIQAQKYDLARKNHDHIHFEHQLVFSKLDKDIVQSIGHLFLNNQEVREKHVQ